MKKKPRKKVVAIFGQRVRQLRKEQNITRSQLAFEAELSRGQICRIERKGKNVSLATSHALSIGFGIRLGKRTQLQATMVSLKVAI